jgi:signal transduction histidine kinase
VVLNRLNDTARLTIRDRGPGVDPARIDKVFEPFVQLSEPGSKPTEGLGLGLPLARELLQLQGGRLSLRNVSAEGGFEVAIEMPLASASPAITVVTADS